MIIIEIKDNNKLHNQLQDWLEEDKILNKKKIYHRH